MQLRLDADLKERASPTKRLIFIRSSYRRIPAEVSMTNSRYDGTLLHLLSSKLRGGPSSSFLMELYMGRHNINERIDHLLVRLPLSSIPVVIR